MTSSALTLAFDTSGRHCAAALLRGDVVIALHSEEMARGQAERLMPLLEDVLAQSGVTWTDLSRIGVGIGPGNFTGIRISVSAARGLALSLGIPAVGVSTFEATSFGVAQDHIAVVPAPRDQAYVSEAGTAPRLAPEMPVSDLPVLLPPPPGVLVENIARVAVTKETTTRPAPLYIKSADAAPSRDQPPKILS